MNSPTNTPDTAPTTSSTMLADTAVFVPDLTRYDRTNKEKNDLIHYFLNKHCHGKRTPTPEEIFEIPLTLGLFKLVRHKNKGRPRIVWF